MWNVTNSHGFGMKRRILGRNNLSPQEFSNFWNFVYEFRSIPHPQNGDQKQCA
jgi:hypothetical protein